VSFGHGNGELILVGSFTDVKVNPYDRNILQVKSWQLGPAQEGGVRLMNDNYSLRRQDLAAVSFHQEELYGRRYFGGSFWSAR
jgi:hypothetical protein